MADDRAFAVDSSNSEQADEWDGADGAYWAGHQREYERLLAVFDAHLTDAADVRPEDRVLDIGCGTGATSRALASRASAGSVLGIDLSGPMLELARQAAPPNVEYVQADSQVHAFEPGSFDAAVSRVGCMFFGEPVTAFANVRRALRPGGRLALLVWQEPARNRWITEIDRALGEEPPGDDPSDDVTSIAPGPFSMADPGRCRTLVESAGFLDVAVDGLEVSLPFGSVDDAEEFLATWMDDDLDDLGRERARASLRAVLEENESDGGVLLESATWLITARNPG